MSGHKKRASSGTSTKPSRKRKVLSVAKEHPIITTFVTLISTIAAIVAILADGLHLSDRLFPFRNEMTFRWTDFGSAMWIMEASNRYTPDSNSASEKTYNEVAALLFTYNNKGDDERVITEMTVSASNIVEDYSPKLESYCTIWESGEVFACVGNHGWGDTGPGQITYEGYDLSEYGHNTTIDISLNHEKNGPWFFNSLAPGNYCDIPIFSEDDLLIRSSNVTEGTTARLKFRVDAAENSLRSSFEVYAYYYNDEWSILPNGSGGPEPRAIGFLIDTSEDSYSQTIPVNESFASHSMSLFPIYIFPKMSCSMSINVTFKTQDEEIIQATPLDNAHFIVPYYTDEYPPFIDGDDIDWVMFSESSDYNLPIDFSVGFPYQHQF